MQEYARLGLKDYGDELIDMRAPNSKTFDLGNGQHRLEQTMGLLHYSDNGLHDIDLEPVDSGDYWTLTAAPYTLQIAKGTPQVTMTDRATGFVYNLSLASINDAAFTAPNCIPGEHPNGHALTFAGLLGDGDLSIVLTASGIKTQQTIYSAAGLQTLLWNVSQTNPQPVIIETAIRAVDANNAKLSTDIQRSALTQDGNLWIGTFQEAATDSLVALNKKTRVASAGAAAVYPLTVIS